MLRRQRPRHGTAPNDLELRYRILIPHQKDLVLEPRLRPRQSCTRTLRRRSREIRQQRRTTGRPRRDPNGRQRPPPPERHSWQRILPRLRRLDRGYPQHMAPRRRSHCCTSTPSLSQNKSDPNSPNGTNGSKKACRTSRHRYTKKKPGKSMIISVIVDLFTTSIRKGFCSITILTRRII